MASDIPAATSRRIDGTPRVFVTRHLPGVEDRFGELFDATLNPDDRALSRDEIMAALETSSGDTQAAAEQLKMSRATLYRKLKSMGVETRNLK